jgi:putative DNA primase/helicase
VAGVTTSPSTATQDAATCELAVPDGCENTAEGFSCDGHVFAGVHVGIDPEGGSLIVRTVDGEQLLEKPISEDWVAEPDDDDRPSPHTTDMGNARRLARRAVNKLIHVHGLGWLVWDGKRWKRALSGQEVREAKRMVRSIYKEAGSISRRVAQTSDDEERKKLSAIVDGVNGWARSSEFATRIGAAISLARSEPELVEEVEKLDAHPHLLNVQDGMLDLNTLALRQPHDPAYRLTRIAGAPFDREADAPTFHKFIERILPDAEVRRYVQKGLGYSLLGRYSERLFIPYGSGANGKSTLLYVVRCALGDYAAEAANELLVAKGGDWSAAADSALADLRGRRLVTTVETEQGKKLSESLVKKLTGEAKCVRGHGFGA